nr:MAG TPA: hypothetical protein [Caudoviricetes sp.]
MVTTPTTTARKGMPRPTTATRNHTTPGGTPPTTAGRPPRVQG